MISRYCAFISSVSPKAESGSHPGVKMLGTALKYVCSSIARGECGAWGRLQADTSMQQPAAEGSSQESCPGSLGCNITARSLPPCPHLAQIAAGAFAVSVPRHAALALGAHGAARLCRVAHHAHF